jgi:hypothetical protein
MDNDKDSKPLFEGIDEFERTYAPEELPPGDPEGKRARIEGDRDTVDSSDFRPPSPAPIASVGSSPSGEMAPPNLGHEDRGGAPGDPETEARYPIGNEEPSDDEPR